MRANMDDSPWAVVVVVRQQWKLCAFMSARISGGFNLVKPSRVRHFRGFRATLDCPA